MRLSANPFDLVGADIEVSEGNLALIVSDHEIGEWPLEKVAIDVEVDGFHMTVDGEQFVFTTPEADAFAAAVGISKPGARKKKSARSAKAVKVRKTQSSLVEASLVEASLVEALATSSPSPETPPANAPKTKTPSSRSSAIRTPKASRPEPSRRISSLIRKVNISNPQGKIGVAATILVVVLAFVARPLLAGLLLFIGMAAVLLIGAASVDPLLATRIPEGWPTSRLVVVALTVIVSGLLLVAF